MEAIYSTLNLFIVDRISILGRLYKSHMYSVYYKCNYELMAIARGLETIL